MNIRRLYASKMPEKYWPGEIAFLFNTEHGMHLTHTRIPGGKAIEAFTICYEPLCWEYWCFPSGESL